MAHTPQWILDLEQRIHDRVTDYVVQVKHRGRTSRRDRQGVHHPDQMPRKVPLRAIGLVGFSAPTLASRRKAPAALYRPQPKDPRHVHPRHERRY